MTYTLIFKSSLKNSGFIIVTEMAIYLFELLIENGKNISKFLYQQLQYLGKESYNL